MEPKTTSSQGDRPLRSAAAPATTMPTSPGTMKSRRTALSPNDTPRTARQRSPPPILATASMMLEPTGSAAPQEVAEQLGVVGDQAPELVLDDLARGVAGQHLHEHDVPRPGEAAQLGGHEVGQRPGDGLRAGAEDHDGAHVLAPVRVGDADDR